MAKAVLKTTKNEASVEDFLQAIKDDSQRTDSIAIVKMMQKATGEKPKMWGPAIIGFGNVHLKYDSGRELDWFTMGFSPRKANLTLYGIKNSKGQELLLKKLGKYKEGKGCLYIGKLSDVDTTVLPFVSIRNSQQPIFQFKTLPWNITACIPNRRNGSLRQASISIRLNQYLADRRISIVPGVVLHSDAVTLKKRCNLHSRQ